MLTESLKAKQRELELSDGAFARRLGVSRPLWVAIRSGQRPVGLSLLRGVVRAFPDLEAEVLSFLQGDEPAEV
jgi:predicted transcriptional regulator